ncbi:MAG: response regulator [Bacteroidetes bacterium]|nr:response regulator [Bacteroidota bacterium]
MEIPEYSSLEGMRVLVVEDNSILQRLTCHILKQWHASVDTAINGKIALELMSREIYDVVLMDLMMPELDGYEATRIIRSREGTYYRNLPIFAFSATPDPKQIMECSMNGIISKSPINKEELYQKISPYLKQVPAR